MPDSPIIEITGISKTFIAIPALKEISFAIAAGESVALLGANGAGKSTLFNIVMGFIAPDCGTVKVLGNTKFPYPHSLREEIAIVADHAGPVPWASAVDLAKLYAAIYRRWDDGLFRSLADQWAIDVFRRLNALSKGQKRLAELALIAACRPSVLVLDEPFNELDPVMRVRVQKELRRMQRTDGTTVFYATHILTEVKAVADRIIVLKAGAKVADAVIGENDGGAEAVFMRHYGLTPAGAVQ